MGSSVALPRAFVEAWERMQREKGYGRLTLVFVNGQVERVTSEVSIRVPLEERFLDKPS